MGGVFINYRVKDEPLGAAAIYRELTGRFGAEQVFRDTDSLRPADHYPDAIRRALRQSDIVLALIGPEWLTLRGPDGIRLIDRDHDWVRAELADAFERNIPVLPVLLLDTPRLVKEDLPPSIHRLAVLQSLRVGFRGFNDDLERLARELTDRVPHLAIPQLFDVPSTRVDSWLPSGLLRPERGVVPNARAVELARLRSWAESPAAVSARLVLAEPGDGKTRLARELVTELTAAGWVAGIVRDTLAPSAFTGLARIRRPLLLVIDDAETRVDMVQAIGRILLDQLAGRPTPTRLLLTSTQATWLPALCNVSDQTEADFFRRCAEWRLGPLPAQRHSAEFSRAGQAFADALTFPAFDATAPEPGSWSSIADVHAAALVALLDQGSVSEPGADPMVGLLHHEQLFWAGNGRDLDRTRLHVAVAAATIFGAASEDSARTLLAALPTFADADRDSIDRYVAWIAHTYPGSSVFNPIRPRRLADAHVLAVLTNHPGIVVAAAGVLDDAQLERALVTLSLASSAEHNLSPVIAELLAYDTTRFLPTAVRMLGRIANPQPLVTAVKATLDADVRPQTLIGMFESMNGVGWGATPILHELSKAMLGKIAPTTTPDPAIAALTAKIENLGQTLFDQLVGPFTGMPAPKGTTSPFNQDAVDMIRTLLHLRNKYPDQ